MIKEPTKKAFQAAWPGGYLEQFAVYEEVTGDKESDIVRTCLEPFYNPDHTVLEIGCGNGFWVNKYLLPNFGKVIAIDVIPRGWVKVEDPGFFYIEVPDRDYNCYGVGDGAIDFVWSFGCFCHLPIEVNSQYLKSIMRVLKCGGQAALFFSNAPGRPGKTSKPEAAFDPDKTVCWCFNDWPTTERMMTEAGFADIRNLLPQNKDTFAYGRKP